MISAVSIPFGSELFAIEGSHGNAVTSDAGLVAAITNIGASKHRTRNGTFIRS